MRAVKIKTRNSVLLFFSLILTLAVFSQVAPSATLGVAQGAVSIINPSNWLYSKANNDLSAYLGKKSSSLPTVRYQKDNDYLEFSLNQTTIGGQKTEISSSTSVSLETNVKKPNTPTLFYRNILNDVDANYQITNLPFGVKEEIILKTQNSKLKAQNHNEKLKTEENLTFIFSAETSAKPVKQSDGSIAFFDKEGNYLFQLDKPFMYDAKGNRSEEVRLEIKPVKTKNTPEEMFSADSNLEQKPGLSPINHQYIGIKNFVNSLVDIKKVLDLGGIEPPESWVTIQTPHQARPRTKLSYHKNKETEIIKQYQIILKADSNWLSTAAYPVVIDPTITHNADANFTGQMNRIADADSTSSTQLESSYPEATKDPYTVLLLHFNEANGTTAGIKDYASTTRVITANGNASTTSYVTQLGMGNSAALDGTGDYFSMPDSDDWNFGSGDFTIEGWVRFNANESSAFASQWQGASNYGWIAFYQNSSLYLGITTDGVTGIYDSVSWTPVLGRWYHIAYVLDTNANSLYFFVDGVQIGATQTVTETIYNSTAVLSVGADSGSTNDLNGDLDGIRIIKGRALTPEEIKAAASRRPYAVYTSPALDASASVAWNTLNWTEGGVNTGNGEQPYSANSLVAQWDFNDTLGTTLTASSSGSCTTSCNGTLTNFAYTSSQDQATTTTGWTANNKKWGAGALMMESVAAADYVSISDPASNVLDPNSADLTIETWIKTSDTSAEIFSNNNANGTACTNNGYYLGIDANGYPVFYLDTNGATAGCDASTTSQFKINDGNWHEVSVVVTRGTSAIIYVDGKSASSDTSVTSYSAITVTGTVYFGGSAGGLDAIIDSTRFYSRALSAAEILSNYNAGNIEIQTRTGATSDPNDGTWEAWKPTTGETQLLSMDSDAGNWNAPQQIDGYTKLLLHMDGTDAAATFPNSATTTHTVTANGNAQVDTAQSKFGGGSGLFDGTGDYLSVADNADWALGGTFTIDAWVRFNSVVNNVWIVGQGDGVLGVNFWAFYYGVTTLNFLVVQDSSTIISISKSWTPVANRWYHVAVVDSGGIWKLFVDGVQLGTDGSDSDTVHDISFSMFVGADVNSASHLNGWIDELRVSKGIARWTSNFTPPPRAYGSNVKAENETTIKQEGTGSSKLTLGAPQIDGNTVALWHLEETGTTTGTYLYDETANNNDATTTGTTVVDGIFGKGRKFNGTSDYVSVPDSANWNFGANDFSIDFWAKILDTTPPAHVQFFGQDSDPTHATNRTIFKLNTGGDLEYQVLNSSGVNVILFSSAANILSENVWHHIALIRNSNNFNIYVDGNSVASTTDTDSVPDYAAQAIIGYYPASGGYLNGNLDSFRILKGRALSADEIAETFRMGANHHLTRQVSATDMSSANKLAFNVAADRPGTYLEAMLGESDYANYELASSTLALSTNTVLYIKGDEIASSTSIKDSSFSGKAITANGNARTSGNGKIGNSVYFDGTGDYLTTPDSENFTFGNGEFTIDFWVKRAATGAQTIFGQSNSGANYTPAAGYFTSGDKIQVFFYEGTTLYQITSTQTITDTTLWHHVAMGRSGNNGVLYIDGVQSGTVSLTGITLNNSTTDFSIGKVTDGVTSVNGYIDEFRIIKGTALTPDQIRQAYEYGLRSHQITIDFGATLQSSDLISNSTDYNFSITATTSGLSATTSGLYLGDKIVIKENLGGTEYTAQGTVNAINSTTGAITVPSWDTGSTFPSGNGYSPNATVFKWQREYFDLGGAATTTRNAITNLTLRPTNNGGGRTVYLDDFRYNTNYLTASSSSAITSSNGRYLQYRAIFSSWDSFVSPYLSALNALYSSTANMFPPAIGVSGGGFLSF